MLDKTLNLQLTYYNHANEVINVYTLIDDDILVINLNRPAKSYRIGDVYFDCNECIRIISDMDWVEFCDINFFNGFTEWYCEDKDIFHECGFDEAAYENAIKKMKFGMI